MATYELRLKIMGRAYEVMVQINIIRGRNFNPKTYVKEMTATLLHLLVCTLQACLYTAEP
jgi:hypothetical protein